MQSDEESLLEHLVGSIRDIQRAMVATMAIGSKITPATVVDAHSLRAWFEHLRVDIDNFLEQPDELERG